MTEVVRKAPRALCESAGFEESRKDSELKQLILDGPTERQVLMQA